MEIICRSKVMKSPKLNAIGWSNSFRTSLPQKIETDSVLKRVLIKCSHLLCLPSNANYLQLSYSSSDNDLSKFIILQYLSFASIGNE